MEQAFNLICSLIPLLLEGGFSSQTGCLPDGNVAWIKIAVADDLNFIDRIDFFRYQLKYR